MAIELDFIQNQGYELIKELIAESKIKEEQILVVGCSSSEIVGKTIGTFSSVEVAEALYSGISKAAKEANIYIAAQCCEHLNRALIIEEVVANKYFYEEVNVVPQPKAGGSFATAAYKYMKNPVAVEHIEAHAGMDIGDTLIGMHLRDVAVPVRLSSNKIGEAHVVCARTRAKFIGGIRAAYDDNKL
ncbi:MAG: TIGR01440 family protein [Lachnospiraceae bacterium]|nr:TIGR01440 family protein [Lachnospiraceae bacterium]